MLVGSSNGRRNEKHMVTEKRLCGVIGTEVALTFLGSMAVNKMIMGGHDFGRIAQRHLSSKKKAADE